MRVGGQNKKAAPRWDKNFILEQLSPLAGSISKVFVCGAPAMNEVFDRAFEEI
jgi:hypothetical protein